MKIVMQNGMLFVIRDVLCKHYGRRPSGSSFDDATKYKPDRVRSLVDDIMHELQWTIWNVAIMPIQMSYVPVG